MGHSYRIAEIDPKNGENVCGDLAVCLYGNIPFMSHNSNGQHFPTSAQLWYYKNVPECVKLPVRFSHFHNITEEMHMDASSFFER